jgi:micrococcal nuclease
MPRSRWVPVVLIGGLVGLYAVAHQPPTSGGSDDPALVTLASNLASTSARFELCGQGARTNCVVDGDTIWYRGVKIRFATIDAPEIHDYKCSTELALGERSKRRLLELMNAGPFEVVRSGGHDEDKYGRKLRDIRRDGKSLGDTLIAEGLASQWEGQHHAWC